MSLKKMITSQGEGIMIIAQSSTKEDKRYPVGFSYMLGAILYTVKEDITKDSHAELRRLQLSTGEQEDVSIETIDKDLQAKGTVVIATGIEVARVEPVVKVEKKRGRPKKQK